ncbi:axonemal dynein light chain domain-containing protein 1 [Danio rerio]|uniref:Axonemal dynein light chain domain-containing 1 n=1 Tax=Danio rerio TaxID=7955 RepID=A4QNW8_DANRE|nr:axonemal dynein light chain domain-containing protein 1 [Danio rerio]AAI39552.1 Si:dkey-171o17.5 protein [Danio rerio]|eukprot:NP_001082846.1 axonemal dynein light chain domain-containing protein 1 [Danio rerio]
MSLKCSPNPPADRAKPESYRTRTSTANLVAELPRAREKTPIKDKSSLQDCNDLIPDELLATLTSTACPQDRLAPLRLTKTPKDFKVCLIHRPDAVWHHPVRRKKYQYFLNQPTSLTGAGRDISFLCDCLGSQKDALPVIPMANRRSALHHGDHNDTNPLETLIPEEYHIIKNKGLKGLQCYDDKFTVLLEDEKNKLRVFPSMKPSGRLEVVQLMKVMDKMLEKAGVNEEFQELTEISQIENLLELIQTEQNIYNIVFHEVIRQVSVECAERGQLLAKLRQKYVALLDRIPRQVKGLHTQTLAQRALDRRLTEEILHFKNSIASLNMELSAMKVHDENVSKEAEEAKEELAKALEESQRNANIVAEYHELYELQRKRLEGQMSHLDGERDLWRKATYSLAVKIIKINKLHLVRRLHISEQTWAKAADRFTFFLTAKDSEYFSHIMDLTNRWKDTLANFMQNLIRVENKQREIIKSFHSNIVKWQKFFEEKSRHPTMKVDKSSDEELSQDLREWSKVLTQQCERYGGEDLVSGQETLELLKKLQESWIEVCLDLFKRHTGPDGGPPKGQEAMRGLKRTITEFLSQLGIRINGESGIHAMLMFLIDTMESWSRILNPLSGPPKEQALGDWLKLKEALGSLVNLSEEALLLVDSTQSEQDRGKNIPHIKIEMEDVLKTMKEFLFSQENFFDCENMRLRDEVTSLHNKMIHWMVDLLLLMVPIHSDDQEPFLPAPELNIVVNVSVEKLEEDARNISTKLDYFSKYITSSCQAIIEEVIRKSSNQDETENELYELAKLQKECGEWLEACRLLLMDVKGSSAELKLNGKVVPRSPKEQSEEHTEKEEPLDLEDANEPYDEYEEEKAGKHDKDGSVIKLIGHDGNITEKTLREDTVQLKGTEELVITPHTEKAQDAFSSLETIRTLQQELLAVETRAINSEVRALKAEEELQAALDKIQDLERQLQARPSVETKSSKKNAPKTPSKPVATSEAKTKSQNPESSPKLSRGTKKRLM